MGSEGGGREEGERGVRGGEKVGLDVEVKRERGEKRTGNGGTTILIMQFIRPLTRRLLLLIMFLAMLQSPRLMNDIRVPNAVEILLVASVVETHMDIVASSVQILDVQRLVDVAEEVNQVH